MEVDLGLSRKTAPDERRESERSWAARVKKRGGGGGV